MCLIKSILWGFNFSIGGHGGAIYKANGVPDVNANRMIELCEDISYDFTNIEVGEILYLEGHVGIYVGERIVIEATKAWDDKVLDSYVSLNGDRSKYNIKVYTWEKHGRLPYIKYNSPYASIKEFNITNITKNSVTISYQTDLPISDILYSLDGSDFKKLEGDTITNLTPNNEYNLIIKVRRKYTDNYTESDMLTFKTMDDPIKLEYSVGNLVRVTGNVYESPLDNNIVKKVSNKLSKITNIYNSYGTKHPYEIDNTGWVSADSISNIANKKCDIFSLFFKMALLISLILLIFKLIKSIL